MCRIFRGNRNSSNTVDSNDHHVNDRTAGNNYHCYDDDNDDDDDDYGVCNNDIFWQCNRRLR